MTHPYDLLPPHTRWSRAVARVQPDAIDPVVSFPFRIAPAHKVATAGSCFAQHIARHLKGGGFNFFVTEDGHPVGGEALRKAQNYGIYSARFGNVYTARQLRQLFERAFGHYDPLIEPWTGAGGGLLDPLRPTVQPEGFLSRRELEVDRCQHLAAVRRMFTELDVFVFTLGLTEGWTDRRTGAALPLCPGIVGGTFDTERTRFTNATVADVVDDMAEFLRGLGTVNPRARVILTVSPVPLAATALDRHVAVSTSYSKSVLRVACEELAGQFNAVSYFPSYEIITGPASGGRYFAADRRSVTEAGVSHVMDLFFAHATERGAAAPQPRNRADDAAFLGRMADVVAVLCDEDQLDRTGSGWA